MLFRLIKTGTCKLSGSAKIVSSKPTSKNSLLMMCLVLTYTQTTTIYLVFSF